MKRKIWAFMALTSLATQAGAASDAATRFGAREDVRRISISPDGKQIAYIRPNGSRGSAVVVATIATGELKAITASSGSPDQWRECYWTTDTRLVCTLYMSVKTDHYALPLTYTRLFAVDTDGKHTTLLSARTNDRSLGVATRGGEVLDWQADGSDGSVLMTHRYVAEATTGSYVASTASGLGVDRVDTVSLKRTVLEPPRIGAEQYISDGHGTVRIMITRGTTNAGYIKSTVRVLYRTPDSREWKPLVEPTEAGIDSSFTPVAVDRDKNVAYGFETVSGRTALCSVALDGSRKHEIILSRQDADVDTLYSIGRQDRTIGAGFATDKREIVYFDPELAKLAASLSKALPGRPIVNIVDATADESKLVVFAGSDVDAGRYYLYDKPTHKLAELLPVRQALAKTALTMVKAMTITMTDGTVMPAYLTLPPASTEKGLPAIVMPLGGPDVRDEWRFDWLAQFFAHRGFAVLQPKFRGSSGYGVPFFEKSGLQSWQIATGDVNDSARWLIKQGIADPAKLAIVGWSSGGYAALQSAVVEPTLFKAIVAIAPGTDLESRRQEWRNFPNYNLIDAQIGHGPHVAAGSPAQHAGRIIAPVLLFHGDQDGNVSVSESRLMASRLKDAGKSVEYTEFVGLDHQLEDSDARAEILDKADGFLRKALALPAPPVAP